MDCSYAYPKKCNSALRECLNTLKYISLAAKLEANEYVGIKLQI